MPKTDSVLWRGVRPLQACWELASSVGTGFVCMIPEGLAGARMCVGGVSRLLSNENVPGKPPLNTQPTQMG